MIEVKVTKTLKIAVGYRSIELDEEEALQLLGELVEYFEPEKAKEAITLDDVDEMLTTATTQVEN